MKKIFLALAVLAALIFSVAPSQALNSMPDDVPGNAPLAPFFLVEKDSGLDTLIVIQEVLGGGTQGKVKGKLHWILKDYKSVEIFDDEQPYTPNDVVPISVKYLLNFYSSGPSELAPLEITLDGTTYYTGYIQFENNLAVDNLVAFMYLVDLANGWAAATTMPVRELATDDMGFVDAQQVSWPPPADVRWEARDMEPYNATALATTDFRQRSTGDTPADTADDNFRLMPRWYLKDANANTWIPIWSDSNKGPAAARTYKITVDLFDEDEEGISKSINIPYEVNWLDIRSIYPSGWTATGGWINIPFANNSTQYEPLDEWLAWSYQTASSASVGANWSVLTGVHRDLSTLTPSS